MFSWGPGKVWLSMLLVAAVLGSPASSSGITEAPADEGPPLWPGAECSRSLVRVERSDLEGAYRAMVHAMYKKQVLVELGWSRDDDDDEPLLRLANAGIFNKNIDPAEPQWHGSPDEPRFGTSGMVFDDAARDGGISPLDMYAIGALAGIAKCPRGAADGCLHSLDPERVLFFGGTNGGGRTSMLIRRGAIAAIATNDPWKSEEYIRYITSREGDIEAALEKDMQTTTVMVTDGRDAEAIRTVVAWRLIQDHYPGVQVEFWLPGDHAKEWDAAEKANARADDMGRIDTSKPVPIRLCRLAARP